MKKSKFWIPVLLLVFWPGMSSANLLEGFDALGGNDELLEQAKALTPESEVRIVQERPTPRRWRSELTAGYTNFFAGDVYLQTQSLDLGYQLHINPRVSLGARYFTAVNKLSSEGVTLTENDLPERLPEDTRFVLDLDPLQQGYYASANFYPFYGKFNLLGLAIVHFDAFVTAGFGSAELVSGSTPLAVYGGGFALWLSKYLSARFELTGQSYEAQRNIGHERVTRTAGSFSLGYLL